MMEYKGYRAAVTYDDGAGLLHGEVVGTRDVITVEGTSVEQLQKEFRFSIDDYLAVCAERGRQPDKPFSGKSPCGFRRRFIGPQPQLPSPWAKASMPG